MIREINEASAISAFCIGVTLNSILIWLIIKKSPKEMRVFSHILLQTCFADLIMLTINVLTQPIYTSDEGIGIVLLNGPVHNLNSLPQNLMLFIWDNCFFFSFFGFAAQFVYRYLIVNRNINVTSIQYFITLFCVLLPMDFAFASLLYATGFPQTGQDKCCSNLIILQILEWDNNPVDKFQLAQRAGSFYSIAWLVVTFFITAAYSIIFFCAFTIRKFIKEHIKNTKTRVCEINDQLNLNMIIQSLLPLLTIIPVWVTLISSIGNTSISNADSTILEITMLIRLPIHWIAVLNPIVTILTVKHYKSAVYSLITRGTATVHSISSQNTQQNNNNNNVTNISKNNQNGNKIIYHTPQQKMVPKSPLICQNAVSPPGSMPIVC
ncbi:hypothetical protein Mgra_00003739 [Meloidogyne graminicola]|uniref:G_PROTEIN_RECEP_F1_2 domain-containing protein n=1 Tax=Meloidogyne graminicola TaxID=189291 RepID=A0A8S9ZUJ4_9BILA|nr:hypothetical protein Mgra_00003739 [Meloidogyne graminicola]